MTYDNGTPARVSDECFGEDARLSRPLAPSIETAPEASDDDLERRAAIHFEATSNWRRCCQMLDLPYDRISLADITAATRSDDCSIQIARLAELFSACGLTGEDKRWVRVDVIHSLAANAPRNELERSLAYQTIVAGRVTMRCAKNLMENALPPQSVAHLARAYQTLSKHSLALEEKWARARDEIIACQPDPFANLIFGRPAIGVDICSQLSPPAKMLTDARN